MPLLVKRPVRPESQWVLPPMPPIGSASEESDDDPEQETV